MKLKLRSHPGYSIIPLWSKPKSQFMEPSFIDLGVGTESDALPVKYDGNFLTVRSSWPLQRLACLGSGVDGTLDLVNP